jgi:hypothetical protein
VVFHRSSEARVKSQAIVYSEQTHHRSKYRGHACKRLSIRDTVSFTTLPTSKASFVLAVFPAKHQVATELKALYTSQSNTRNNRRPINIKKQQY